jgi:hypothetical protein
MFDTTYISECHLCHRVAWPLYKVCVIRDEYKPHYRRMESMPVGEPITVCHPCLRSRNDLVEVSIPCESDTLQLIDLVSQVY